MLAMLAVMPPETATPFQAGGTAPGGAPGLPAGLPNTQSLHAARLATAQRGAGGTHRVTGQPSWRETSWVAVATQLVSLIPAVATATLAQPGWLGQRRRTAVASPICGTAGCETTPHGLVYGAVASTSVVD